jgi:thiol:disulfide interchange protein DsbD
MRRFFLILTLINTFLFSAGFGSFSEDANSKFLTPQEAFKVDATTHKKAIKVDIKLGNKIHIYKNKLKVLLTKPTQKDITPPLPKAKMLDKQEIYEGNLSLQIPFDSLGVGGNLGIKVKLTGCSDAGICYAPQEYDFNITIPKTTQNVAAANSSTNTKTSTDNSGFFSKISNLASNGNSKQIVEALKSEGLLFILALFFIVGLLLALTPCILPMVPILSSILIKQANANKDGLSRGASFSISLVYVVSMAAAYAVIGVVAGMLNFDLQANANNPYVIIPIALIFIALAFSLFGYYELAMPSSLQTKLNKISNNAQGKGYFGTAVMGAISALVVGACTAPVISGAIIFISITGDALLGGLALFVMGLGAGMPLLLVGLGANKFVPKPGGWMENVSKFFGVLMLLMALYIARGVISPTLFMMLFSALLVGSAIFFGVFDGKEARGFGGVFKVFNFFILIYGVLIFIGAISGAKSVLNPLEPFTGQKSAVTKETTHQAKSYTLNSLLQEIKNANMPVVVDIGKENCAACTELAEITFPNKQVQDELKRFKFIKLDITKYTKDDQDIMKHFKLFGAPNILFFNSKGKALEDKFQQGFVEPKRFVEILKSID